MHISWNMILDQLHSYELYLREKHRNVTFKGLYLFEEALLNYCSDYFYIGNSDVLIDIAKKFPDISFLYVHDPGTALPPELPGNLMIVCSRVEPATIFNQLQDFFFKIQTWDTQIQLAIANNQDLQELFNLTEDIFKNPIVLLDPGQSAVAYMKNTPTDDQIYLDLKAFGRHQESTLQAFRTYHLFEKVFEEYEKTSKAYVREPYPYSPYTIALKPIPMGYNLYFILNMCCCNRENTPGLLELFEIFIQYLTSYLNKTYKDKLGAHSLYEYFLRDLLDQKTTAESAIIERAKYFHINHKGIFCLFKIALEKADYTTATLILKDLLELLPEGKPFIYKGYVVILMEYNRKYADIETCISYQIEKLSVILDKYHVTCGVSKLFSNLKEIPDRYIQATEAIRIGKILMKDSAAPQFGKIRKNMRYNNVFQYDEFYIYHMIAAAGDIVNIKELCCNELFKIMEYDEKHNVDNFNILYVYLNNERKATETAASFHMHRNNILYRIQRIEEMFNLDLNDSETRLKLLLSYKVLNLYGKVV